EGGSRGRKRDRCNQKYCNERPCQNPGAGPKMMHDVTFCELKADCRLVNAKRGSLVALAVKWCLSTVLPSSRNGSLNAAIRLEAIQGRMQSTTRSSSIVSCAILGKVPCFLGSPAHGEYRDKRASMSWATGKRQPGPSKVPPCRQGNPP